MFPPEFILPPEFIFPPEFELPFIEFMFPPLEPLVFIGVDVAVGDAEVVVAFRMFEFALLTFPLSAVVPQAVRPNASTKERLMPIAVFIFKVPLLFRIDRNKTYYCFENLNMLAHRSSPLCNLNYIKAKYVPTAAAKLKWEGRRRLPIVSRRRGVP